jgi:hypothetical protein
VRALSGCELRKYLAAYTAAVPLALLIKEPERRFVALALADTKPAAPLVAVMSPMIVNAPVEALLAPAAETPAVTFPVTEIVPVAALFNA